MIEPFRRAAVHHVQTAIPPYGEAAAREFYGVLLGLEEIDKPAALQARGGVWFQTSTVDLHLGVDRDFQPARKAHVAFTVHCLEACRSRMRNAGLSITDGESLPGYRRFYVCDPFGNRVELLELCDERLNGEEA
jgi:catechol 2,3-dioxygenase-like lactoylglutathione lyase family enzyme